MVIHTVVFSETGVTSSTPSIKASPRKADDPPEQAPLEAMENST